MLTASGANYGFRRSLPHISGGALGVAVITLAIGAAGSALVTDPWVRGVLKWVGLVYLLWLAWKIGSARPVVTSVADKKRPGGKPFTWMQGALFQLVNAKLWAGVVGAVATYGSSGGNESPFGLAAALGVILGTATFACTTMWTLMGVQVGRFIRTERTMRLFNWTMAGMLVASLIPVVAE
jgi:threonine/homoserine/homoserine lactone efflux protein